jgi:hypothetical protein
MLTGVACVDDLTGFACGPICRFETDQSIFNGARPQNGHLHQEVRAGLRGRVSMPLGHRDCQPSKVLAVSEKMENWSEDDAQRSVGLSWRIPWCHGAEST